MLSLSCLKAIAFLLIWFIMWLPIAFPLVRWIDWQPGQPLTAKQKLILLASFYPLAPLTIYLLTKFEGISLTDCGLRWQPSMFVSLVTGLVIGILGILILFFLEWALGLVIWQWQNGQRLLAQFLPILIIGLGVSITEELVFRGFLLEELISDYTYWLAAIISSIIFALLHLVWEQKQTIPQLPGLWLMGMVLAGARLVDNGSLGLAWGLHSGWIFGLSCLESAELIAYTDKKITWITGINQQPLAGLAGIFCLSITGAFLWWLINPSLIGLLD
jgi:hypothetical protein